MTLPHFKTNLMLRFENISPEKSKFLNCHQHIYKATKIELNQISLSFGHYLALRWRHNGHDGVSNNQPHDCLRNRLFKRWSKKTSKLRVTGLCAGNSPGPMNSPHKWPVTRKMSPFDDVTMDSSHFEALLVNDRQTECRYNAIQYNIIFHIPLHWLM